MSPVATTSPVAADTVTVVLSDDHEMFAEGMKIVLGAEDDLDVLAVAHDGDSTVAAVRERPPDVLVVDFHMPRTEFASLLAEVREIAPETRVLTLSGDLQRATVEAAIRAGAHGFLSKDASTRQVVSSIRRLAGGETGHYAMPAPPPRAQSDAGVALLFRSLSPREREVLALLAAGYSNRRIAEHCFLSLNTVRTHVQNILVKLGVHSKLEAAAFALEHRAVQPGGPAEPAWPVAPTRG